MPRPPLAPPKALLATLCVAVTVALGACFVPVPEGPPAGYERDVYACGNRFDDDGDRLVDCRDPDCIRQGFCNQRISPLGHQPEPEDTAEKCTDLIDNDDDGRFDCGDPDCTVIFELCCSLEFDDVTCSNGIDDDGNGFADCADNSCSRNPFVTVCESETDCTNNVDDDGDRRPDCYDTDCEGAAACVPGGENACDNGDDDHDGRADCDDRDCYRDPLCTGPENTLARCVDRNNNDGNTSGPPDNTPILDCNEPTCQALTGDDALTFRAYCMNLMGPETTLDRCSDGVDNDGNGHTDCEDFSCCGNRECSAPASPEIGAYCASIAENTLAACTDGVDNDGNTFTDCDDFSCCGNADCTMPVDPALTTICARSGENTLAACMDGVDNDRNGFIDCNDFSCCGDRDCATPPQPEIGTYCQGLRETTLEKCTDGIDNDNNGFTDCNDFSCSRATDEEVARHCATFGERSFALCTDGIDNDGNGFPDCQDFSCREVLEEIVAPDATGRPVPTGRRRSPCLESVGADDANMRANCMDGADNDRDGFVDCEDWDCNWNPVTQDLCDYPGLDRPRICG
ncbi:MAG: hypothetical protein U0353_24975 [Sandaracinus sp.]